MGKEDSLLRVENLTKYYTSGYVFTRRVLGAKDVSFSLKKGEILSLVGESGSGKTTVANMILRLIKLTRGNIYLDGRDSINPYTFEHFVLRFIEGKFEQVSRSLETNYNFSIIY